MERIGYDLYLEEQSRNGFVSAQPETKRLGRRSLSRIQQAAMATKVQRIMTQPIVQPDIQIPSKCKLYLHFKFHSMVCLDELADFLSFMLCMKQKARIQIWLFEQKDLRIEGRIIGFDEYMNLVLEDAEEVSIKKKTRKALGQKDSVERGQHYSDDEYV
uniref:Small nuclear ribonucleoprotein E n=1 Tax=Lactuca sativa TaxID=4236 RepID=A0A9R1WMW8_LACSA|nr:hypothetical protein LSAT_V11C100016510 [Lactuca sativa]